jgi:raffinose/stachyose/melibiose transport system substrate-binding protein
MRFSMKGRRGMALMALAAASTLFAAGCSAGSLGSSSGGGSAGGTTITFLTGAMDTDVASAKAVINAFQAANPNITIKTDTRPGGSEGDNLVKTRLSTGDMAEVFIYNNGSLLQALKPEQNLTPLDDQPWASQLDQTFADSSKGSDGKLYGGPYGTAFGGGVLYNIPVYKKLGLQIPKTWDDFMKNNATIKKAGIDPVEQTYGETWTSQLFVLGDYHNVEAQVPDFAAKYTAGQNKYANTPAALAGFQHIEDVKDAGYFNKDYASAKLNDGVKAVATGTAAHYPQLGATANNIENVSPGKSNDVGFRCTSRSRWRATSWRRRRSSSPSQPPRRAVTPTPRVRRRRARTSPRRAGCRPKCRRSPRTPKPTSNPVRRARRWSSSHRSRGPLWSRSASRWAPVR